MLLALALGMSALNTMAQEDDRPLKRGESPASQDEPRMDRPARRAERLHAQRDDAERPGSRDAVPERPALRHHAAQADREEDAAQRETKVGPQHPRGERGLAQAEVCPRCGQPLDSTTPPGHGPRAVRNDEPKSRDGSAPPRRHGSAPEDRLDQDPPAPRPERHEPARTPSPDSDRR